MAPTAALALRSGTPTALAEVAERARWLHGKLVDLGIVLLYAVIALFELVVQKSAVSFVVALHAAALWLRANTKLRKAAKTRELSPPSPSPSPPPSPRTPVTPTFDKTPAEVGLNNVKKPDARRVLFAQVEAGANLHAAAEPAGPTPRSLSTVPAPPPAPPMLKLAYGLKYEGTWQPTRMWEAHVVVAVTNAMQDARLSRADAWAIRS